MALFDAYIQKLADYQQELQASGRQVRKTVCPTTISELKEGLPIRVGPKASSGIILRGDTFIELGNPDIGSSAFILWTDNTTLIRDGSITLIGPDIPESAGASLPFGQVLMVGGTGIGKEEHALLEANQYIADQIEGYMIKSIPQHMWSRVSLDAAGKGFNFEILGRALMAIYRSAVPKIEAMEVMFVTSSKEDLLPLDNIGEQIREISSNITKETWKAKGYDIECIQLWDCESCPDSSVCDEIKGMVTVRKKTTKKQKTKRVTKS
jgi:CO dehydrogenase/acetyl-CoA synthase beta subunit